MPEAELLDRLRKMRDKRRRQELALHRSMVERDNMIRLAYAKGARPRDLIRVTGLTHARVFQILREG